MDKNSSKAPGDQALFAGEAWFDPIEAGLRDRIRGLKKAEALDGVHVIHAGTALDDDGKVVSAGGRVLGVGR